MKKEHVVYVIEIDGFYKVGSTESIKRRLSSYATHYPKEVPLVFSIKVGSKYSARLAEFLAHKKLKDSGFHHKLEWFVGCSKDEVIEACKSSVSETEHIRQPVKEVLRKKVISSTCRSALSILVRAEQDIEKIKDMRRFVEFQVLSMRASSVEECLRITRREALDVVKGRATLDDHAVKMIYRRLRGA